MTHGFLTATLTAPQLAKVRGNHKTKWLAFLNPNTVKLAARVNQAVFGASFDQVTFDTVTVGAFGDVKQGWTVYFSHTSNIKDYYFRGRARKVPTSNTLYINQESTGVVDNDYIFVVKETALHIKLAKKVGDAFFFDSDISFRQLLPIARGLPSVAHGRLASGGFVDIALTPNPLATTSGSAISTHLWDGDGGAFQVGSSSTENVTLRFNTAGWYEVRYTMTDDGGRSNFVAIPVIIYPADYSSIVALDIKPTGTNHTTANGLSASFKVLSDADLTGIIDQNQVVVIAEDNFGGTEGSIITSVKFNGRLRQVSEPIHVDKRYSRITRPSLEADSLSEELGRLILATVALRRKAAPAVMGEIANLTLWRAIVFLMTEFCTASNVASLDFDSTDTTYTVPLAGTEDRSAGDSIEDLAFTINAVLMFSTSSAMLVARDARYMSSGKGSLVTAANWTTRDYTGKFAPTRQHVKPMGRVIGFGGSLNTGSETVLVLRARAPAVVWGPGEGRKQFNRQVLPSDLALEAAKVELAYRTGADFAISNLSWTVEVQHPSGYDNVLVPSVHQRYTWTAGDFDNTKYWLCTSVAVSYDDERGLTSTVAQYVEDLTAINAQVIAEIAPDDFAFDVPGFAPFIDSFFPGFESYGHPDGTDIPPDEEQPYTPEEAAASRTPPGGTTDPERSPPPSQSPAAREGSIVLTGNASGVWRTDEFIRRNTPDWINITPGTGVNHGMFNPHGAGGWVLSDDLTDSILWRTDNILGSSPTWNSIILPAALYTLMATTDSNGKLYAYAPEGADGEVISDDLTSALGPDTHEFSATYPFGNQGDGTIGGSWQATGGRTGGGSIEGAATTGPGFTIAGAVIDLGSEQTVVAASFWYRHPSFPVTSDQLISFFDAAKVFIEIHVVTAGNQSNYTFVQWTGSTAGVRYVAFQDNMNIGGADVIDDLSVTIDATGQAITRYSTDNGATFAAAVDVGASPAAEAGFHGRINDDTVLAAADAKVRTADAGGSYSDATGGGTAGSDPLCIWSYGEGGSDTSFLMGSAAAVGGETLWKVVAGVATAITPNDGVNDGLVVSPGCLCTAPEDDSVIFALMNFGGTIKLARSTNGGTSWAFTTGIASTARWIRVKNAQQVYIANGTNLLYSEDGGVNFSGRTAPGASLLFVEVR